MTGPFGVLEYILSGVAIIAIAAGIAVLRQRWLGSGGQPSRVGWLLVAVGLLVWSYVVGAELATTYVMLVFSILGYVAVLASMQRRTARQRDFSSLAEEPEERRANWSRIAAKSFLAIVLAGIAAVGIGVAFATGMPLPIHDRIVIGGLLVPLLWGAGMAWTLADAKTVRAALLLAGVSIVSYAIAFLPKYFAL